MTQEIAGRGVADVAKQLPLDELQIAVLIPCYHEIVTIAQVVKDFRRELPSALIYVYDNNSTDGTAAAAAGALVEHEPFQGKGDVVRRMFSDIEADIFILVDRDSTYDAAAAPRMIARLIDDHLDLVNGVRRSSEQAAYRLGHRFGNLMLTALVARGFCRRTSDMLTGYRVFSRRFVKSFPSLTAAFETETEIIVHALQRKMLMADVETEYGGGPEGSESKLSTIRDGMRILRTIGVLIKEERPLAFFGMVSLLLLLAALVNFVPVYIEYRQTGLVRRFPTTIPATGMVLASALSMACGLILSTVTLGSREMKRLIYLQQPRITVKLRRLAE